MTAAGAMNITDFLQERIAEDESEAEEGRWVFDLGGREGERFTYRVLAECKAKREIVGNHDGEQSPVTGDYCAFEDGRFEIPCPELRHLATVYASHPDYNPAWAPES